jgi:hypothetical protein
MSNGRISRITTDSGAGVMAAAAASAVAVGDSSPQRSESASNAKPTPPPPPSRAGVPGPAMDGGVTALPEGAAAATAVTPRMLGVRGGPPTLAAFPANVTMTGASPPVTRDETRERDTLATALRRSNSASASCIVTSGVTLPARQKSLLAKKKWCATAAKNISMLRRGWGRGWGMG